MISAEKIIIDVNGILSVQREEYLKPQALVCPFRPGHHYCGEWCPHFGNVEHGTSQMPGGPIIHHYSIELSCGENGFIEAPEFVREGHETDHLAEIRGIMEPPQASFKERLHQVEMRMYPDK